MADLQAEKIEEEGKKVEDCGHGNYLPNGQNIAQVTDTIIVISSSVCGQCGQPSLSVNKIKIEVPKRPNVVTPIAPPTIARR